MERNMTEPHTKRRSRHNIIDEGEGLIMPRFSMTNINTNLPRMVYKYKFIIPSLNITLELKYNVISPTNTKRLPQWKKITKAWD